MAQPQPDANTLARWKLDETALSGGVPVPTLVPVDLIYPGTFSSDVSVATLTMVDASFATANATCFQLHVPGVVGRKSVGFFGGTASEDRDYAFGAPSVEPPGALTFSSYVFPFSLGSGLSNVFGKDYRPANLNILVNGLGSETYSAPFVTFRVALGENVDGRWQVDWTTAGVRTNYVLGTVLPANGSVGRARIRINTWNHVGVTHDGVSTLKIYLNGILVLQDTIGPLDYGTHGDWNLGGTAFKSAAPEHLDGQVEDVRIENTVRSSTWFEDMFLAILDAGGDTGPPVVNNIVPAPGGTLGRQQVIQFDVTDDVGLRRALPMVQFPGLGIWELVHNGDAFADQYQNAACQRFAITGGFRYQVLRTGGWPSAPVFRPFVYDTGGNENA